MSDTIPVKYQRQFCIDAVRIMGIVAKEVPMPVRVREQIFETMDAIEILTPVSETEKNQEVSYEIGGPETEA